MQKSKIVDICIFNPETGEIIGKSKKHCFLSASFPLEGNQFINNWVLSFIRGLDIKGSLGLTLVASDFKLPEQKDLF